MIEGICEIHGGEPMELEHIQFCGEHVNVCLNCLENQTGATSKDEWLDITDDSYFVHKTNLLTAAGK